MIQLTCNIKGPSTVLNHTQPQQMLQVMSLIDSPGPVIGPSEDDKRGPKRVLLYIANIIVGETQRIPADHYQYAADRVEFKS